MLASVAGLLAAWLAAGSLGIVAEPLGRAAIYLLVALALIAVWDRQHGASRWIWVALGIWLVPLCVPTCPLQTLLLVTATWNLLASSLDGADRRCLRAVAVALLVLVAYRWCCESVGVVWWLSDQLGRGLGSLVGWLAQRPLRVGASFAGVDFLLVMWVLFAQRLLRVGRSELRQTLVAGLAILLAHGVYLVVLAWAWDIFQWLPRRPDPTFDHPYIPPAWDWAAPPERGCPGTCRCWRPAFMRPSLHCCCAARHGAMMMGRCFMAGRGFVPGLIGRAGATHLRWRSPLMRPPSHCRCWAVTPWAVVTCRANDCWPMRRVTWTGRCRSTISMDATPQAPLACCRPT